LTGLRAVAVAIAIVVARHAGEVSSPALTAFAFGFAGVEIFFVLSGFLLTSLLVGEHLAFRRPVALADEPTARRRTGRSVCCIGGRFI
jgi:peptidoglycan/LPS O-acetylase OafA/YrhL